MLVWAYIFEVQVYTKMRRWSLGSTLV